MNRHDIEILVSGEKFVGGGYRTVNAVIEENIEAAETEIIIATYRLTSEEIVSRLEGAAERGVRIKIVLDQIGEQPEKIRKKIESMVTMYPFTEVKDFFENTGHHLHAKVIIFDRKKAIIGSANLTYSGMVENHEVGCLITGRDAEMVTKLFDSL